MQPVFSRWTAQKRTALFTPFLVGILLLVFLVIGLATHSFLAAMLLAPIAGVGGAYALVGWPEVKRKDGKPLVEPHVRPWLFFPLFLVLTGIFYVVLGVFLTPVLPVAILAYATLAISLVAGGAASYFLVGFPDIFKGAKETWRKIPEDRRPWLFFPLGAILSLLLYFLVGLGLTQTSIQLEIQPLIALPIGLIAGFSSAYFLVGFPRPRRSLAQRLPKVPGKARPHAFLVTTLLAGAPLGILAGYLLQSASEALPAGLTLVLATLLGLAAGGGLAMALWGTPRKWRGMDGYEPGVAEPVRAALVLPVFFGTTGVMLATFASVGWDLFWGLLAGAALGLTLGLWASGILKHALRARAQGRHMLADLPDMVKPLVLFPLWLVASGFLFLVLTNLAPSLFSILLVGSLLVGLVLAVWVVEAPLFADFFMERRREKDQRAQMRKRRAERLAALDRQE